MPGRTPAAAGDPDHPADGSPRLVHRAARKARTFLALAQPSSAPLSCSTSNVLSHLTRLTQLAIQPSAERYIIFFCVSVFALVEGKTETQIKSRVPCCRRLKCV